MTLAAIIFVLVILVFVFEMLRRQQLREKYAVLWIVIGIGILVLAIFPQLLRWLSSRLGFQVPSNLLFTMALVLLIGVALHVSWELSHTQDEIRILAEDVAILRTELEQLHRARIPQAPPATGMGPETGNGPGIGIDGRRPKLVNPEASESRGE